MLESLSLKNFTAFSEADFKFAKGLNVIIGENGAGKTHVLKVAYSAIYVCARGNKEAGSGNPTKAHFQAAVASKLNAVFKPDELGRLARRDRRGRQRCDVSCSFSPPDTSPGILVQHRQQVGSYGRQSAFARGSTNCPCTCQPASC